MDSLKLSSYELFKHILAKDDNEICRIILKSTYFLDPRLVKRSPVMHPDFVRESKEHHPGKKKGSNSEWEGRTVKVTDNTKARNAFEKYSGIRMGGKNRTIPKGWDVAHIWGRVYDPRFFTAGWNICLMPDFLRNFCEEQSGNVHLQPILQKVAFELYIQSDVVPIDVIHLISEPKIVVDAHAIQPNIIAALQRS